jgi:predicted amino acid racemase
VSTVESILGLLAKWPAWKRITESPDRIDQLTARIEKLEASLSRVPGLACPSCGALQYRAVSSRPHPELGVIGTVIRSMRCGECTYQEDKTVAPANQ